MKRIRIRAGKKAYNLVKDGGFSFDAITTYVGPAVGPRWLVASGFDLALIEGRKLGSKAKPVLLAGASAGAWRFAAWVQPEPRKSYTQLLKAYIRIPFKKTYTPEILRDALVRVINAYVKDDAIPFALANDHYRLAFTTARARHLTASEIEWVQRLGLGAGYLFNRMRSASLPLFFERVVFYNGPRPPHFCLQEDFRGKAVPLNPINFKDALLASGAIPMIIYGNRDIYGAPRGIYRDGGIVDYHLNHDYAAREKDVSLFFHHQERVIPGWLDRNLKKRRPRAGVLDSVLMVYPSEELVQKFPNGKVPDREDFAAFIDNPKERIKNWEDVVELCAPLGELFIEAVDSGKIRDIVEKIEEPAAK
ncbi:MAG: hypothetical protein NTV99_09605 [Deltaproteobacteria bacterium]|nr:hypothetical protein [Deltaproteobacteria bacterium]